MRALQVLATSLALWSVARLGFPPRAHADERGTVRVEAGAPGVVQIDERAVGSAPVEVQLAAGRHSVRIDFAGGGALGENVLIEAARTSQVRFAYPRALEVATYRRGMHAIVGVNPFFLLEVNSARGVGGLLELGFNLGINPRTELRGVLLVGGGRYGEMQTERETALEVALRPSIRFNYGAAGVYSMDLGLRVGLLETWYQQPYCPGAQPCTERVHTANLAVGPDLSLLSFRLGTRRQYELAVRGAVLYVPIENRTLYVQVGLAFTYLHLTGRAAIAAR